MDNVRIRLSKLRAVCDPIENPPWTDSDVSIEEVHDAIADGRMSSDSFPDEYRYPCFDHAARIAYLVHHKDETPIVMDPRSHEWLVIDGNHRLYAAMYREDLDIEVAFQGFEEEIHCMLTDYEFCDPGHIG